MVTDYTRQWLMARLSECEDLPELRRVWNCVGDEYRNDARVIAARDVIEAKLKRAAA